MDLQLIESKRGADVRFPPPAPTIDQHCSRQAREGQDGTSKVSATAMIHSRMVAASALTMCFLLELSCARQMPALSVDPIPNGGVVEGIGSFTGSAVQTSGIRSVTLYVDTKRAAEAQLEPLASGTPGSPRRPPASSQWRASMNVSSLSMGVHYLTVLARANDGTYTQQTLTMIVSRGAAGQVRAFNPGHGL